MLKLAFAALLAALAAPAADAAAALTETELMWLKGAAPVLRDAEQRRLPVDIVVQPQVEAGHAPLAMGYVNGRCKLVLTMRGNPQAETTLQGVPEHLKRAVIEAVTAHEIGHCWRYVQGAWHTLPAGFSEAPDDGKADRSTSWRDMRRARREEGYADLVAMAWTLTHHPEHYRDVHGWLTQVRDDVPVAGSFHDTRAWVRLARDASIFGAAESPFEQALGVWKQGLLADD
ncbi:hypothetical protein [Caldimonas brevitalea]|uniref:Uncharacterized protein n=1 Tax=Caldimonas brevitalea TaxID=413882 RepID=A0A0G3BS72_9BURK|nr:hypothetical protein [Caldimonas brevitalea]AKJ29380.1 hypothetical protein AAW51_2689 [Caldimonas brevitalea]